MNLRCTVVAALAVFLEMDFLSSLGSAVTINEIRTDQPGEDTSEYFELFGEPNEPLDGLTYLVIGDGEQEGKSGVIESLIHLDGLSIPESGIFLTAEATFESGPGETFDGAIPDLEALSEFEMNFEDDDNVTHLLVRDFNGDLFVDLDEDDDGQLDELQDLPWSEVVDGLALIHGPNFDPPLGIDFEYATQLGLSALGPEGDGPPRHVFRLPDDVQGNFQIGEFLLRLDDTPGDSNVTPVAGDTDCDGDCDFDDIAGFVLGISDPLALARRKQMENPEFRNYKGFYLCDVDFDGDCDFDDIDDFVAKIRGAPPSPAVPYHAVPETSTRTLLMLGWLGLVAMVRQRNCSSSHWSRHPIP